MGRGKVKLEIKINCDGAAFEEHSLFSETAEVLGKIANNLPKPTAGVEFYVDINGNTCASAEWID